MLLCCVPQTRLLLLVALKVTNVLKSPGNTQITRRARHSVAAK